MFDGRTTCCSGWRRLVLLLRVMDAPVIKEILERDCRERTVLYTMYSIVSYSFGLQQDTNNIQDTVLDTPNICWVRTIRCEDIE
jgi:hypothetical protein